MALQGRADGRDGSRSQKEGKYDSGTGSRKGCADLAKTISCQFPVDITITTQAVVAAVVGVMGQGDMPPEAAVGERAGELPDSGADRGIEIGCGGSFVIPCGLCGPENLKLPYSQFGRSFHVVQGPVDAEMKNIRHPRCGMHLVALMANE
ncbi:MAG TPA: hypothetical protein PLH45_01260 [Synergistales bacterium]|nr:hypothetical protein [Synergistales bacterium]